MLTGEDLRGTGNISAQADIIIFIIKPNKHINKFILRGGKQRDGDEFPKMYFELFD